MPAPQQTLLRVGRSAFEDESFVAIAAFDKAGVSRNAQPNARMAQAAHAAVTGDFPRGDSLGFWRFECHGLRLSIRFGA